MTGQWRYSPQQLDPLGGVTAQSFAWVFTFAAGATGIALTLVHSEEYHAPILLVGAFLAFLAAAAVVLWASSPRHAFFSRRSALTIHVLMLLAVGLEAAAQWGTNTAIRSDWAPLAFALLVMTTGCFRPAVEILAATAVSTVGVAAVTIAGASASHASFPPIVYVGLTAGPLLAAGVGAAAFSATLVTRLVRWRADTGAARIASVEQLRSRIREDLQQERLAMIEGEIGPFLREVRSRGEADAATVDRSRRLGDALRDALVAEADEVWLDDLVAELNDPSGLAARMDEAQRAAVEAACAALAGRSTRATLARNGESIRFTLQWERGGGGRLGPELQAMLRQVFPGARMRLAARIVEVEFDG